MERNPFSQFEDDDDESDKKSNKKSTKVPRRVPLGLEVDAAQEVAETEEKKPPSFAERLGGLFEKKDGEEDEKEKERPAEHSEATEDEEAPATEETPELDEIKTSADAEFVGGEFAPDEGDLSEVNEIRLTRPAAPSAQSIHETITTEEDEAEPTPNPEVTQPLTAEVAETIPTAEVEPDAVHEEPAVETSHEETVELPRSPVAETAPEPEPEPTSPETFYEDESMSNMAIFNRERERFASPEVDAKAIERDLNEAEYRGEKRGQSRGVVTGLFFGWLFGRRGKKKMERNYEKQLDVRDKEIKSLNDEQFIAQERLQAIKRNQERLQTDMLRNEAGPVLVAKEALDSNKDSAPFKDKQANKELPPEEREITEETFKTAKGHHVETSTWHRIERDLKTGKIVENPDVAYGQEFQHETKQEVLREDSSQDDAPAALQLGSVATLSPQDDSTPYDNQNDGQLSSGINFSLPKTDLPASKQVKNYMTNPVTWAVALVLVLALIIFGFLG